MSVHWKTSIIIWILAFFTFLAGLNSVNATIIWATNGIDATVPLYIIGNIVPSLNSIPVITYLWMSLISTFILLGLTTIQVLRRPPLGLEVQRMVSKVEDEMLSTRGALEATRISLFAKMEDEKLARQDMFTALNTNISNVKKEMLDKLEKEVNGAEKTRKVLDEVRNDVGNLRQEVVDSSAKHIRMVQSVERLLRATMDTAERDMKELANLTTELRKLETELVPPKPRLTSGSGAEEVKGVGPRLAEELKTIGITSVGKLLFSDPKSIGARTRATPELAMRLQERAQLLMVPNIDEIDAEMLLDVGIASRRELSTQDPLELGKRLDKVATTYVEEGKISESEKPTIEEISSWIKLAKL